MCIYGKRTYGGIRIRKIYLLMAINIIEKSSTINDNYLLPSYYNSLGNLYTKQKLYDKSEKFLKKAITNK